MGKRTLQEPPKHDRRFELDRPRFFGIVVIALVPVLAIAGVFGDRAMATGAIVRIGFIYFFLMFALRVMGKREMSEMSPFELVTLLMVPEIFSAALSREEYDMTHATVGVATLLTLVFLTSLLTFRFRRLEDVVEGTPTILVNNGRLIERNLKRERVTADEVFGEMHKAGLADLSQVRWAILEVDGKISIIPKAAS
jgi:uncharacterized membrane protein YcaP (DUF421 family)